MRYIHSPQLSLFLFLAMALSLTLFVIINDPKRWSLESGGEDTS